MNQELTRYTAPQASLQVGVVPEIQTLADAIAKSRLWKQYTEPAQVFGLMMLCHSKGLHPMQAVERYDLIEGKPTMKAQAMQAAFQEAGGRIEWVRSDDEVCHAIFTHSQGGSLPIIWDIKRAQKAGLMGKQTWQKHTAQMLRNRCVSEGVRGVLPGIVLGIYTPDEQEDINRSDREANKSRAAGPASSTSPRNVTPASPQATKEGEIIDADYVTATASPMHTASDPAEKERLQNSVNAFAAECKRLGVPVASKDGLRKIINMVDEFAKLGCDRRSPSCWAAATTHLAAWWEAEQTAMATEEVTTESEDGVFFTDDDLTDPFAE